MGGIVPISPETGLMPSKAEILSNEQTPAGAGVSNFSVTGAPYSAAAGVTSAGSGAVHFRTGLRAAVVSSRRRRGAR